MYITYMLISPKKPQLQAPRGYLLPTTTLCRGSRSFRFPRRSRILIVVEPVHRRADAVAPSLPFLSSLFFGPLPLGSATSRKEKRQNLPCPLVPCGNAAATWKMSETVRVIRCAPCIASFFRETQNKNQRLHNIYKTEIE